MAAITAPYSLFKWRHFRAEVANGDSQNQTSADCSLSRIGKLRMAELQVRVIPRSKDTFVWLVVDHVWDGISAPIAIAPNEFQTYAEAMTAGLAELQRIEATVARDHPLQD